MRDADLAGVRPASTILTGLGPLMAVVFLGFLSVGAPLPVLTLQVHDVLGFGTFAAGWVVGLQSLATVITRHRSGTLCDQTGPRRAVLLGLPCCMLAGVLYLASAALVTGSATASLVVLLAGRLAMGLGESLFMTGTMAWGIARLGAARTGTVMSWQGLAMYAALGLGAPLGLSVQAAAGFTGVSVLTIVAPLLALVIAFMLPAVPAAGGGRVPFHHVIRLIWRPGIVLTLATVPFAALATFLALDYASKGWPSGGWLGAGAALSGFAAGYVLVRLLGAHLPDRFGAARVAGVSLAIEALGQTLLWQAPSPGMAVAGAVLSGLGFSLIFPAMGVLATRSVPAAQRGRAVGNFVAFFDVSLGLTGPVVGALAGQGNSAIAFATGAVATLGALIFLLAGRGSAQPNGVIGE